MVSVQSAAIRSHQTFSSVVSTKSVPKGSISQAAEVNALPSSILTSLPSPIPTAIPPSVKFHTPIYHLSSQKSFGSQLPCRSGSFGLVTPAEIELAYPSQAQDLDINPSLATGPTTPSLHTTHAHPNFPTDAETQAQLAWLGYRQELFRDWDFWSSLSLSCLNIGTIPGSVFGMMTAMRWGGPSVLVWGYLLGMAVMLCLSAVIAELASAFPAAGAMLTWTFKLARANTVLRNWARFISWLIGTLLFFAHVVIQVALTSQCTSMIISTLNWKVQGWQKFLVHSGYLITCGLAISSTTARSPKLWIGLGVLSLCLYLIIFLSLILTTNAAIRFPDMIKFENHTDFDSDGFVFLMGWSLVSLAFGAEASAHLAEETKQPASNVPKALFCSTLISYILGCILNLCLSATLPPLKDRPLSRTHIVDLIFAHCSRPAALFILCSLLILMFLEDVAQLFASSRFTWAMARDRGFPFAHVWRRVSTEHRIPRMATCLLVGCSILAAGVISIQENVFESLITSASYLLLICYLVPVAIYLSCEMDVLQYDGRNVWSLRGLSRPCAWISVIFLTFALFLMACPVGLPITAATWSWSPLVLLAVTALGMTTWMIYGRTRYVGPIKSITLWTTGQEVEFPYRKPNTKHSLAVPEPVNISTNIRGHPAPIFEASRASWEEEEVRTMTEDLRADYDTGYTSHSSWLGGARGATENRK
ncbi:hypothetical protein CROQUDRAFT_53912 [Cronartium quercuum f. sp. fusiforme G11]|uniref:Uncharacterized protein n=1 Tax=Cronartium quercuum f. sp. fusiforme G11 TaxID=708437 RepID=A0A9P6N6U8_9BASI|nr:hypothetical protein CROQUDRAFT_53912 [Cronartium quercuum f. sp. fusiforme G11]